MSCRLFLVLITECYLVSEDLLGHVNVWILISPVQLAVFSISKGTQVVLIHVLMVHSFSVKCRFSLPVEDSVACFVYLI